MQRPNLVGNVDQLVAQAATVHAQLTANLAAIPANEATALRAAIDAHQQALNELKARTDTCFVQPT